MWDIGDGQAGTTKEKLRQTDLGALEAVDRVGAYKAEALKSGKFTPAGAADDTLQFAIAELAPCSSAVGLAINRGDFLFR